MFETFKKHQVNLLTKTKVTAITATTVETESEEGTISLPCDYVIMAVGAKPNAFDITPLTQAGIDIHLIGDCHEKASDINHAIEEGYLAANNI